MMSIEPLGLLKMMIVPTVIVLVSTPLTITISPTFSVGTMLVLGTTITGDSVLIVILAMAMPPYVIKKTSATRIATRAIGFFLTVVRMRLSIPNPATFGPLSKRLLDISFALPMLVGGNSN
jgi:hypothetical protein